MSYRVASDRRTDKEGFSLKRWSQRKHAVAREVSKPGAAPETQSPVVPASPAAATDGESRRSPLSRQVEGLTFDTGLHGLHEARPSIRRSARSASRSCSRTRASTSWTASSTYIDDYTEVRAARRRDGALARSAPTSSTRRRRA
jgi:hypothetical protein